MARGRGKGRVGHLAIGSPAEVSGGIVGVGKPLDVVGAVVAVRAQPRAYPRVQRAEHRDP